MRRPAEMGRSSCGSKRARATSCVAFRSDQCLAHNRLSAKTSLRPGLKEQWSEQVQIATPGLPFVGSTGRLVENMFDPRLLQEVIEADNAGVHTLRFGCAH